MGWHLFDPTSPYVGPQREVQSLKRPASSLPTEARMVAGVQWFGLLPQTTGGDRFVFPLERPGLGLRKGSFPGDTFTPEFFFWLQGFRVSLLFMHIASYKFG